MQIQGVKGTQDIFAPEGRIWRAVENIAVAVHRRFGYDEVRTPILEHTELFSRSIGGDTDIVSKEMYTFLDKGNRSVTMRPEGTAPLVRAFLEHKIYGRQAVHRFFYLGPMFRYERAQKGRLRQFHQIGAELYGLATPLADAEIVALQHVLFSELGVPGLALEVNNLGTAESRKGYADALREHLRSRTGELCADCVRRTAANPLRALDCKVPACAPALEDAPSILDYADSASEAHFAAFCAQLERLGIPYVVNPRIVRGLDYYTKVVFEFTSTGLGAKNTLSAGGRYDDLITELGGPATPAVGFACGIERLLLLLGDQAARLDAAASRVFVAVLSDEAAERSAPLILALRQAGVSVEEDLNRGSLKAQMKAANRVGADFVVLIGGDELAQGSVTVRDMASGEQQTVAFEARALADFIRNR